ncbi:TPA: hypothetical protein SLP15_004735 [Klebsiella aerogenes]|nr:hypothetical protein [Klebsiella aerogenes]
MNRRKMIWLTGILTVWAVCLPARGNFIVMEPNSYMKSGQGENWQIYYDGQCSQWTVPSDYKVKGKMTCGTITTWYNGKKVFDTGDTYPFDDSLPVLETMDVRGRARVTPDDKPPAGWYNETKVCITWYDWLGSYSGLEVPGAPSACTTPPPLPTDVVCTANSMTIDHGQVSPSTFNGSEKSGTGSVKCINGDASVKLYFSSPTISFSNGGKSSLTFSNGSISEIVSSKENVSTSFTIKSKLSSSGPVKTGDFSGSTTIIADIQ